jgi:hypothetical protein
MPGCYFIDACYSDTSPSSGQALQRPSLSIQVTLYVLYCGLAWLNAVMAASYRIRESLI